MKYIPMAYVQYCQLYKLQLSKRISYPNESVIQHQKSNLAHASLDNFLTTPPH